MMQVHGACRRSHLLLLLVAVALFLAPAAAIKACSTGVTILAPGDGGFDFAASRGLLPEPKPGFIAQVTSREQISTVLKCAKSAGIKVCVRSGGHSFLGLSQCTGVMIDVAKMKDFSLNGNQITLGSGNTLGEMFHKTLEASGGSRMVGIGLCPSVGVAGYLTGGGFNPYSGKIGLTCESMVRADLVLADGSFTSATRTENSELFWASCGGGGGALGVLYSATLNTSPAGAFNNNVFFRYKWPKQISGEVIHKHIDYDNENGNTWVRLEASLADDGVVAYGACWDSSSVANCEQRLSRGAFFNVAGRTTVVTQKSSRVQDFQGFIGPAGNWARKAKIISDEKAFVGTGYADAELGYTRLYTSGMYRYAGAKPPVSIFQSVVDTLLSADPGKIDWILVQFNPWTGRHTQNAGTYSFPHRDINSFTEYIGGKDSAQGGALQETKQELNRVQGAIQEILKPWLKGVYANYPEEGFQRKEWEYLYWGNSLSRLGTLRGKLDPSGLFTSKQILPIGRPKCPGTLAITGTGVKRNILIQGYPFGQLSGMTTGLQVSPGCTISDPQGALITSTEAGKYEATANGGGAFGVTLSATSCTITTTSINGIPCSSPTVDPEVTTTPVETKDPVVDPVCSKTQPGQRCAGAPNRPAVPWLGGCCVGECQEDESKGWGKWCPDSTDGPPGTTPPTGNTGDPTCSKTQPGQRCAGAPNRPAVPWLGGCCVGECQEDASKGWGKWCPE